MGTPYRDLIRTWLGYLDLEDERPDQEDTGRYQPIAIGAWAGTASLANPKRDVAFARSIGLDSIHIIVNDHSRHRTDEPWSIRDKDAIRRLASEAHDHGLLVHFMSWIKPNKDYLEAAREDLIPLGEECMISSLMWDAEEPWTQYRPLAKYANAALLVHGYPFPTGATGIGYTPESRFGPLARACDYVCPQCYATSSSGLNPRTVVPKFVNRYTRSFGALRFKIGLAAYRQNPQTCAQDMAASFAAAEATPGADEVVYWSLNSIRKTRYVARAIERMAKERS